MRRGRARRGVKTAKEVKVVREERTIPLRFDSP